MAKRAVGSFFIFVMLMGVLCLRIMTIATGDYAVKAPLNNTKSITLSDERAPIYDCGGEPITNSQKVCFAAVNPTEENIKLISESLDLKTFDSIKDKLVKGYPAVIKTDDNTLSGDGIKIIETRQRYSSHQPAAHVVGYINDKGEGVYGLEKSFDELFSSNRRRVSAVFASDANGRALIGADITKRTDSDFENSGVYTTIDLNIQLIVERSMDTLGIKCGAVAVLDSDTGAVRAMASRPAFDPNNLAQSLESEDAPFVNRAMSAFSVGSVFKPAIAAAALEQGLGSGITYDCTGSIKIGSTQFGCYEHRAHGRVDMRSALEKSCNAYFINLAQKLDRDELISILSSLGFGSGMELCSGMLSSSGYLPTVQQLDSGAAVANLSFGQGSLMATPLQICAYMSVFASNGIYHTPYLIEKTVDGGKTDFVHESMAGERVLSVETAQIIAEFLKSAVENGNGSGAKPENCTAAGKTATAQTGVFENGEEIYNTWFAGWFPAENPQYVITVMKEHGSGGASDCAPVFKMIADEILKLNN